ncbi:uncharacterized protein Z518_09702 [Rhinocladiella mackenziei CBS 650.93]|uniref:Rhinocladiella mackenziei CBS 650.93 unplaced genomic scaffold supercont1.8, whole genome shotgun sequence n=1 Tax=Rhinocladiella mackenziei CBS 650.93 TaxID=1442369 RepID=A0A0D2FF47_9EURO|nr:uncharacterized protein Z518_09702 [Rhinocladiella mackenziei CBS 650.93]KIX00637.1 hypothetical protein Z518_09702 [Rhinocladiella mackenziei CBS 650.93]
MINPTLIIENQKSDPIFAGLLHSKSFFWLATGPSLHGEWEPGWNDVDLVEERSLTDSAEPRGDRRQEVVFVGEHPDVNGLTAELNKWEKVMKSSDDKMLVSDRLAKVFEDGFEDWPELVHGEEDEEGYGHNHDRGASHHQHQHAQRKIAAK